MLNIACNYTVGNQCLLNCSFCKIEQLEINDDKRLQAIKENKLLQIVNILGGDPLISPKLETILNSLTAANKKINIFTPLYTLNLETIILKKQVSSYIFLVYSNKITTKLPADLIAIKKP